MPNLEEHEEHTLKRYGVRGTDVHKWMDDPSRKWRGSHRQFRHDTESVKLAGELFGAKYGIEVAENIALDHIMLDHKEEIQARERERQEAEAFYEPPPEEKRLSEQIETIIRQIYSVNMSKLQTDLNRKYSIAFMTFICLFAGLTFVHISFYGFERVSGYGFVIFVVFIYVLVFWYTRNTKEHPNRATKQKLIMHKQLQRRKEELEWKLSSLRNQRWEKEGKI